jgi:hypothetical protein
MRDPLSGEDPVMVRSDVLAVPLDDSLVLYDPVAARAHLLNRSAGRIWAVLQVATSIEAAVAALVDGSGTSAAVIENDVRAAVEQFAAEQLLGPPRDRPIEPMSLDGWLPVSLDDDRFVPDPNASNAATLALLDRTVAITSPWQDVIKTVDWFAAPTRTREPAGEGYELTIDPAELRVLPSRLNRLAAASSALVALHAAGVAIGDAVVALPAGPGAGKSTLAAQLVAEGAGYLTDEVLGVAPGSLAVAGYPKRLTLERGSWPLFPQLDRVASGATHDGLDPARVRWVDARDLHPAALDWRGRALRLGLVVVPQFRPGATVEAGRLLAVDAIVELLTDCFNLGVMGEVGLEALREVATAVPCYRLVHGDSRLAATAVRELASDHGLTA